MIVPMIQSRSPFAKPCPRGKPPVFYLPYTSSQGMKSRRGEEVGQEVILHQDQALKPDREVILENENC